ncbi:MAG TPA: DUF2922 domain-containing protein [Firmicutes bacterium]|nr:DUF2922 domain-containing protein [Bacillota bacterium]
MARVLRMFFENAHGQTVNISLREPVDPLDAAAVNSVMDKVVLGNIFSTGGGDIIAKLRAETIETTVESVLDFS